MGEFQYSRSEVRGSYLRTAARILELSAAGGASGKCGRRLPDPYGAATIRRQADTPTEGDVSGRGTRSRRMARRALMYARRRQRGSAGDPTRTAAVGLKCTPGNIRLARLPSARAGSGFKTSTLTLRWNWSTWKATRSVESFVGFRLEFLLHTSNLSPALDANILLVSLFIGFQDLS